MTPVLRSVTTGFLCLSIAILIGCGNSSDSEGSGDDGPGNETEIDGVAFEYTGALQFYTVPDDAVALNIAAEYDGSQHRRPGRARARDVITVHGVELELHREG